jgi:hypothetical protein
MSTSITLTMTVEEAARVLRSVEFCADVTRGLKPVPAQNLLDLRPTTPALAFLDTLRNQLRKVPRREALVTLKQVSAGAPEQWEGRLADGTDVFARERHGHVRVEVGDEVVLSRSGDSALDALAELFDIPADSAEAC